jgi:atypical dual specificity phosphatase
MAGKILYWMFNGMVSIRPILLITNFNLQISGKKILRSLNLEIFDKEITILMGPSGTGKSTLLRTLAGLNQSNPQIKISGDILYQDKNLFNTLEKPVLVQQKLIHLTNTVKENILSHLPNRSELELPEQMSLIQQIAQDYDQAWILDNLNRSTATLERYQSKILAILYTMLSHPTLLMLDEPTTGLTDQEATLVHDLIRTIAKTTPILIVSHHIHDQKN